MVYKAMPPLFSVKTNGKQRCFTDNYEMIKFNQKAFSQKYQLLNSKKVPLTPKELTLFFIRNADYNFYLDDNNMYPIETPLFEDIITCYVECGEKVDFIKLQKLIKSKYRFVDVIKDKTTGLVKVVGTITKSNMAPLSEKFFNDCKDIIKIIKSNDCLHYYIDNQSMTINQIMTLYEKSAPNGVHRYKGLGETSEEILEKSVMSPLEDRVLIQYTLDDIKEALTTVREYESDKKKILSLVGNVTREDLIE